MGVDRQQKLAAAAANASWTSSFDTLDLAPQKFALSFAPRREPWAHVYVAEVLQGNARVLGAGRSQIKFEHVHMAPPGVREFLA